MRVAARLVIAGLALVMGGAATGCSAGPGLAYAQGVTRPSATAVAASDRKSVV